MPRPTFITGLDIGSTAIRVAVAQAVKTDHLQVVALAEVPSIGINKGVVSSID